MYKSIILTVLLGTASVPALAEMPSITSPGETMGVLERKVDVSSIVSLRPLPRPLSVIEKSEKERKVIFSKGADIESAPLSVFETAFLSQDGFKLKAGGRPFDAHKIANETYTSEFPNYALAHLPSEQPAIVVAEAQPARPLDPMVEVIRQTLSGTYEMSSEDGDSGYNRLLSLAEGNGYARNPAVISSEAYVEKTNEVPSQPEAVAQVEPNQFRGTVMGMDPAAAILNSISKDQLANMSPEQITALVMAAQGRPMDVQALTMARASASQVMSSQMVPHPLSGIPSLDYRGDSLPTPQVISAADVPSGSMPFDTNAMTLAQSSTPAPPAPMRVGDGQNLLLKGWSLGLTGTGEIGMYMVGDPGSIIEISEGMVIGPLGTVQSLRMENGNIIAKFSTGEEMVSPAALVSMASL